MSVRNVLACVALVFLVVCTKARREAEEQTAKSHADSVRAAPRFVADESVGAFLEGPGGGTAAARTATSDRAAEAKRQEVLEKIRKLQSEKLSSQKKLLQREERTSLVGAGVSHGEATKEPEFEERGMLRKESGLEGPVKTEELSGADELEKERKEDAGSGTKAGIGYGAGYGSGFGGGGPGKTESGQTTAAPDASETDEEKKQQLLDKIQRLQKTPEAVRHNEYDIAGDDGPGVRTIVGESENEARATTESASGEAESKPTPRTRSTPKHARTPRPSEPLEYVWPPTDKPGSVVKPGASTTLILGDHDVRYRPSRHLEVKAAMHDDNEEFAFYRRYCRKNSNFRLPGDWDLRERYVIRVIDQDSLSWKERAARFVFLMGDAPPHLDYGDSTHYVWAMRQARERGIMIVPVGASGLRARGEFVFRQMGFLTRGPFVFLHYGETGESEGAGTAADPGKVSHHTGSNYEVRRLDDIVVDIIFRELGYGANEAQTVRTYLAPEQEGEMLDVRLENLLLQVVRDDLRLSDKRVVVAPFATEDSSLNALAQYLWEGALEKIPGLSDMTLVERARLEEVLKEHALDLSGVTDAQTKDLGTVLSADYLVLSRIHFLGIVRVCHMRLVDCGSGQVLAAGRVKL